MANIKELILSIEAPDSSFDEKLAAINQMEETLVAMRQQEEEAINDNVDLIVEAINVMQKKVNDQLVEIQAMVPEKGDKGDKGDRGLDGKNGVDGKNGRDGRDGKDGKDGKDGVSVTDAKIDFDGSLIITLSTGQEINVGEVVASDLAEKIHHISTIGVTSGITSITSNDGSVTVTQGDNTVDLSTASVIVGSTQNIVVQVRNTTGATLTKGTAVYISGATGQIPTVTKALATTDTSSAQTLGLINANLTNNTNGYVTVIGIINDIDTSAYTDGAQLYLSGVTAGTLTATKPYAPTHLVYVAVVEYAHAVHGKLFVKVQNGYELDEIHNVSAQSPTTGQTIVYNSSTGLWEKSFAPVISGTTIDNTIIGGTTPAAGTFTTLSITGSGNNFTGDFSNATVANRNAFKTSTTNGSTGIYALPNGTSTAASWQATNAADPTNASKILIATNGSTDVQLVSGINGSGSYLPLAFYNGGAKQVEVGSTPSAVNYQSLVGSVTAKTPVHSVAGTDTNIALAFQSKGTGAIDLAAGSSGVNISNGGTVTAITLTSAGNSTYTTAPTVAITAPTTAGGVQATATIPIMVSTAVAVSGGTGYTVNDVLTVSGGTFTSAAQLTVSAVSGGVITAVTTTGAARGQYTVAPSNPASVTGGTGTGATFTLGFSVANNTSFTITNAGSGYVEQPTVSFSGGGGSGAAAYATVGSVPKIQTLATQLDFFTPGGRAFMVEDGAVAQTGYIKVTGSTTSPYFTATGSATDVNMGLYTKGAGAFQFRTNFGTLQFNIAHTASAVNYVQVTGAATGNGAQITAQGSDTNIGISLRSKGTGDVNLMTQGSVNQVVVRNGGNGTNYLALRGSSSGSAVSVASEGSDTNIDLALTPKGTGALVAQASDGGVTINARGANAVDWQTTRTSAANVASGTGSVVGGGQDNRASGTRSVAVGGNSNISSGYNTSIVGGTSNSAQAGNGYSFLGAGSNNQSGGGSTAWHVLGGGHGNTALGWHNAIFGGAYNSTTSSSTVTTQAGTANATTTFTLSGSNASIKVGQYITGTFIATETYVAAISGTTLTLSQAASGSGADTLNFYTPHGVVVGGGNNQATGAYSFIGGGGDAGTAAQRNVASGDWSFIGGGVNNTSSGLGSVVCGGGRYSSGAAGNIASSNSSAVVAGINNTASGGYSFIGAGAYHNATGNYSAIMGGQYGSTRAITGYHAFPACSAPTTGTYGTTQAALLVLGTQTTDATATVLRSDTSAASTTNQLILPNNSAYYFRGEVVSGVTGGGNTKGWYIEGVIKRGANAASTALVGTPTVTSNYADAGASTWTIAVTADTTNGGLAITFTGQAGTTIRTVAQIRTTEMTY